MTGTKRLAAATLMFVITLLFAGVFYPDTFLMSLADTSPFFTILRAVIIILLIGLLVTNPPRSQAVRVGLAAWGLMVATLAIEMLLSYRAYLLDVIVLLEVAIICGLEALESRRIFIPVREQRSPARKVRVLST